MCVYVEASPPQQATFGHQQGVNSDTIYPEVESDSTGVSVPRDHLPLYVLVASPGCYLSSNQPGIRQRGPGSSPWVQYIGRTAHRTPENQFTH